MYEEYPLKRNPHRFLYHSTLGLRVIKKKKKKARTSGCERRVDFRGRGRYGTRLLTGERSFVRKSGVTLPTSSFFLCHTASILSQPVPVRPPPPPPHASLFSTVQPPLPEACPLRSTLVTTSGGEQEGQRSHSDWSTPSPCHQAPPQVAIPSILPH